MSRVIGIDLGTTNSVVACLDQFGRPEVLADSASHRLTPSMVYFGVDPPAVGHEAREYARLGDDQVAALFKPHMGDPNFRLVFGSNAFDAEALSAIVLESLRDLASERLGTAVQSAVITVPAYFADAQRQATLEAGRRAGLEVLRIINEPTAAALAYGLQKTSVAESILIYDLGGGTFDVTIARIEPGAIEVLATTGDHDLGGRNWDEKLGLFVAEECQRQAGFDPMDDPVLLADLMVRCEQAKWTLSDRRSARITLQHGSERCAVEVTRDQFEAMARPLVERTDALCREALDEAGLDWPDLAGTLLVGGSTRMPMVRRYLEGSAGRPPRAGVNVDEVVALGAAVQAALEQVGDSVPTDARPQFTLGGSQKILDVMSHSLGAVAVSDDRNRYINDIIVRRNRPIPAEEFKRYLHETHGGTNDRLEIYLTQGESAVPLDCAILGKYVFSGIRPTAEEVAIEVNLRYDRNGVVQVEAHQRDTGHLLEMTREPVPDDLTWLGMPPATLEEVGAEPLSIYLLIDASSSMAGIPLAEAQRAAREFLSKCDMTTDEIGVISFASDAIHQCGLTDNPRRIQAALNRIEAEGTTNLAEAIVLAHDQMRERHGRACYLVILTDGYPDEPEQTVHCAELARANGLEIVAIGTGLADRDYLRRLASTEEGSIFAKQGELVQTFGHIARVLHEGGRGLRVIEPGA